MKKWLFNILPILLLVSMAGCYSCQSWNEFWGNGPRESYPADKFFWEEECRPMVAKAPAPKPRSAPTPVRKATPTECGPYMVTRVYPCGDCGVVKLDKVMPEEVQLNAPFNYDITVTNLTDVQLMDVVVTEHLPKSFKFDSARPAAKVVDNKLIWMMDSVGPRQTQKISVRGSATGTDCLKHCATITYVMPACANVKVVQPQLKLSKTAPSAVLICEPIPVKMVVTNTGTGDAENVKVADTLPDGLMTSDGKRSVTLNAGTLAAGQSKQFSMELKASKTGKYVNEAVATAAGGLKAEASTTTVVRQPVLAIAKSAPERRYLGRSITYEIAVTNKGDAPASDLVLEDGLPAGTKFVSATGGGTLSAGKVVWRLGTLAAGASRKVSLTVMPTEAGTVSNVARASATCAEGVSSSARTAVSGIAAVLLEVIDIDDPVEIGSNTTYVITATNQGSTDGTNIRILCTLEENMQYVSSSGATRGTAEANTVTFAPLARLAPKQQAVWRVVVKAVKPGDVRFKVTMNTDQIDRPVEETEATHLYE